MEGTVKKSQCKLARLGFGKGGYPHVLVDRHGWCLRLGRQPGNYRYYSTLPLLLQAVIEHVGRQRLPATDSPLCAGAMRSAVRTALRWAVRVGKAQALRMPG